jgi:hypothetical protein
MSCVLRVEGKTFDVDAFLADSSLEPYDVFHAGEPRKLRPERGENKDSGFKVDVSDASWEGLRAQVSDAIAFLDQHRHELERLRAAPGVEDVRLDFAIYLRMNDSVWAQYDYFPPEIVSRAGALGIGLELSIYPPSGETPDTTGTA